MHGADLVVKQVAALVETAYRITQHLAHQFCINLRSILIRQICRDFKHIQQPPGITICVVQQQLPGISIQLHTVKSRVLQCTA